MIYVPEILSLYLHLQEKSIHISFATASMWLVRAHDNTRREQNPQIVSIYKIFKAVIIFLMYTNNFYQFKENRHCCSDPSCTFQMVDMGSRNLSNNVTMIHKNSRNFVKTSYKLICVGGN